MSLTIEGGFFVEENIAAQETPEHTYPEPNSPLQVEKMISPPVRRVELDGKIFRAVDLGNRQVRGIFDSHASSSMWISGRKREGLAKRSLT